tara:strand:+ start:88 stop:1467 length:1380 start_codon:yes stop_codon:yes gene_type:complete
MKNFLIFYFFLILIISPIFVNGQYAPNANVRAVNYTIMRAARASAAASLGSARINSKATMEAARINSEATMGAAKINERALMSSTALTVDASKQVAFSEAMKDNYENVKINYLKDDINKYQYLVVKSIKGISIIENTSNVVNILKTSKIFSIISTLIPNPTHWEIPKGILDHKQTLFFEWYREALGEYIRITTITISTASNQIIYKGEFKNKSYQEILSILLTGITQKSKSKEEAVKEIKNAKELLNMEVLTQDEFDKISNELKPIILGYNESFNSSNSIKKTVDPSINLSEFSASELVYTNYKTKPLGNYIISKKNIGDSVEFVYRGVNYYGQIIDLYGDTINIKCNNPKTFKLNYIYDFQGFVTGVKTTSKGLLSDDDVKYFRNYNPYKDKVIESNKKIIFLSRGKFYKATVVAKTRSEKVQVYKISYSKNYMWFKSANQSTSQYVLRSHIKYISKE